MWFWSASRLDGVESMLPKPPPYRFFTLMVSLILLASFALRAYRLDAQSLWSDEGISLNRSAQPLTQLLTTMPVEQLPGYYVLFHFWLAVAGDQDFALRFFSLWPSVLAVAVIYRLAVDLGNQRAGVIAALLLAINPFQLWYAQEVRTYSWLMASSLLSTWCFWQLVVSGKWGWLFGYVVATTLTIYLHFYGFLVPFAHAVFLFGWVLGRRDWRLARSWLIVTSITALLFLPWLPRALQIFGFSGWREPLDPWQLPWRYLTAYTVGSTRPPAWPEGLWSALTWLYLALISLGAIGWGRQRRSASLFLLCQAVVPLLAVFLLALRQPDAHERYTIFIAGPLLLLAAGGVGMGRFRPLPLSLSPLLLIQLLALVTLAGLLFAGLSAVQYSYVDPALQKPDFRSAARAIQQLEQPGDVILVDGPNPELVFLHYYKGLSPVHDLRFLQEADSATIVDTLTAATAEAGRAWEVLFFHPPAAIQHWLALNGWTAPPTEYNGIRVTLYGLPKTAQPATLQPLKVAFGPALLLATAGVTPTVVTVDQPVWVTTNWQVQQAAPDYKFSLRLLDGNGGVVLGQDYIPQNWFGPTHTWPVGQMTADQRGIWLPGDLAPGRYQVTLRLYDPTNGVAVDTAAGQDVVLGEIAVLR